ncbi:MAG TPA: hypothetical protein VJK03_03715 [Candidatus Nanoarchaeia archaeon]|nr:hypothetical protein [Candidatus Nanoarchaeia archaeon]
MGKWYLKIWENGDYFDLWHVNHFLAGILLAGATIYFKLNFILGLIISMILMLSWEIFEVVKEIRETKFNRIMDILLGVAGFFLLYGISKNAIVYVFAASLIVWTILELWGYIAYRNIHQ